jgi:hypothetical protein
VPRRSASERRALAVWSTCVASTRRPAVQVRAGRLQTQLPQDVLMLASET